MKNELDRVLKKREAYKVYYEANREKILEKNRQRQKERYDALVAAGTPALDAEREKKRESYHKTKGKTFAKIMEDEAETAEDFWKPFLLKISKLPDIERFTTKHVELLLQLTKKPRTE